MAIKNHLKEIEIDYSALCDSIGAKKFNKEVKLVVQLLANVDSIKQEKYVMLVDEYIETYDETKSNAIVRMLRGGFIQPLFNGYVQYSKLCSTKNIKDGESVLQELDDRYGEIIASKKRIPTSCKAALAAYEKKRFEDEVTAKLSGVGVTDTGGMKLGEELARLKEELEEAGTKDLSAYTIDTKKYFKKQSDLYGSLSLLE